MTAYQKKYIRTVFLTSLPILLAYVCSMVCMNSTAFSEPLSYLRSILYILVFSTWTVSVYSRIIQKKTRWYLIAVAVLMIFWIATRTIKFDLAKDPCLVHWLWYVYYLPLIYIPLFSVFVSLSICQSEDFSISWKTKLLYIPAAILLLFVLTNDLHQLVFIFPQDGPRYPLDGYRHGPVYYVVVCWIILCFSCVVGLVFTRNRMTDKKRRIRIPVAILVLLGVYSILYIYNLPFIKHWISDFTVVFCLCFLAFYESLFRLNLIQNNTHYSELFRCSSVPAVIVDSDYNKQVSTATYTEISDDIMRQAQAEPIITQDGIRLSSAPIRNGHVLWEEDISGLLALNKQLASIRLNIEEQNTAEFEAYQVEYQRHQLVEKNRLYDKLQAQTQDKVERLSELLDELDKTSDPRKERQLLLQISVIGAYIKRRNNLSFLSEDWEQFPSGELKNCTEQSIECLTLFGIDAEQDFCLKKDMLIEDTIRLYEAFEEAIEYSLDTLSELILKFSEKADGISMSLRLCTEADFSSFSMDDLTIYNEGNGEWLLSCFVGNGGVSI